jgi:hypothetical protein
MRNLPVGQNPVRLQRLGQAAQTGAENQTDPHRPAEPGSQKGHRLLDPAFVKLHIDHVRRQMYMESKPVSREGTRNSPYPTGQNPLAAKERKERRENSKTQYLIVSQLFFTFFTFFALFCGYSW